MKKKILLSILTLLVFSVFTINVNATSLLNVENTQEAKAPTEAPASNATLYSTVGNGFDLSKIKFGNAVGTNQLGKIYVGYYLDKNALLNTSLLKANGEPNLTLNTVFTDKWFTAYCLDGTKKFPQTGIYAHPSFYTNLVTFITKKTQYTTLYTQLLQAQAAGNTETVQTLTVQLYGADGHSGVFGDMVASARRLVNIVVYAALANSTDTSVQNMFTQNKDYSYNLNEVVSYLGNDDYNFLFSLLDNLQSENGDRGFKVYVTGMKFINGTNDVNVTPSSIGTTTSTTEYEFYGTATPTCDEGYTLDSTTNKCKKDGADDKNPTITYTCPDGYTGPSTTHKCKKTIDSTTTYAITFKSTDILFDIFKESGNLDNYGHALWILEHTYPTLSLEDALVAAGATLDGVKQEVRDLYSPADEDLNSVTENVVYGIIQYALWYSVGENGKNGVDPNGVTIGTTIVNVANSSDQLTNLNSLYEYLIRDRDEYATYATATYSNEIKLTKPKAGKEIFKETKTAYTYGPYSATYSVLEGNGMNISARNDSAELSKIKFIDEAGHEITKLTNGQKFYVVVEKSAKIGSVKLHLEVVDPVGFSPASNRGHVYSPRFVNAQNVMTGGKIESLTVAKNFDLVYNPKTGVENIAVLLMVTLVAFSLGYLVLSYRSKPVGLN